MKSRKKSKRKTPKHARAKAHRKSATEAPSAESRYGWVPQAVAAPESPIGLASERNLFWISPEDAEDIRRKQEQLEQAYIERVLNLGATEPRAMAELRRLGIDERRLVNHLWGTWCAHHKKIKKLSAVPGVSLREIKKLPNLLRKLAGKVELINRYGYSLTEDQMLMLMVRPLLQGMYMAGQRLPSSLRLYARDLSARLGVRTASRAEPGTAWKVQTVEFVRECSRDGGQHYDVIARLMNAFNKMEDERERKSSRKVTPASLKQLWLDHPEFRRPH